MNSKKDNQNYQANDALKEVVKTHNDEQAFPTLAFEPEHYRQHLEQLEISDEEADAFLKILWEIMHTMVDLGMGLDNVQLLFPQDEKKTGQDSGNDQQQKQDLFNQAANQNQQGDNR